MTITLSLLTEKLENSSLIYLDFNKYFLKTKFIKVSRNRCKTDRK